jgi:hypothetical protein
LVAAAPSTHLPASLVIETPDAEATAAAGELRSLRGYSSR